MHDAKLEKICAKNGRRAQILSMGRKLLFEIHPRCPIILVRVMILPRKLSYMGHVQADFNTLTQMLTKKH
jgi:hypothetical protein